MLQARGVVAREGDVALIYRGYLSAMPLRLTRGAVLQLREGVFAHDDMIGQQYGRYMRGRLPGHSAAATAATAAREDKNNNTASSSPPLVLLLQNSADLWTLAVPHRTQIIYDTDMAVIVLQLRLRPGSVVAEAGTGSGSLTHALVRAVAPHGRVYTFDFHPTRCRAARGELRGNGLHAGVVCCDCRDVCRTDTTVDSRLVCDDTEDDVRNNNNNSSSSSSNDDNTHKRSRDEDNTDDDSATEAQSTRRGGFGLPAASVDAVFLDVPSPWLALDNVRHVLREDGVLCTFSPCIEQTQRTVAALRQPPYAFVDVRTVEALTHNMEAVYTRHTSHATRHALDDGDDDDATATTAAAADATTTTRAAAAASADGAPSRPSRRMRVRRCNVGKGHSAYLTFARRRRVSEDAA